jgi:hypothetical protein
MYFPPRLASSDGKLVVRFQEVVHAKESWEVWFDEGPKTPNQIQRMNYHSNARRTLSRLERRARGVIEEGWTQKKAATIFCVSKLMAARWADRYTKEAV